MEKQLYKKDRVKKGFIKRNSFLTIAVLVLFIALLGPLPAAATPLPDVNGSTESLTTDVTYTNEYIGHTADGTLNHSAGTNTITNHLYLGYYNGITGYYNLSGTGFIDTYTEFIGNIGNGYLDQSGGTNDTDYLYLGFYSWGYGEYNLSAGTLTVTNTEIVGHNGTGVFNQTGGMHSVTYDFILGGQAGGNGTYNLTGGTFDITRNMYNGVGTGTLNIDGGTLTVGGGAINVDYFNVGYAAGTTGSHTLTSGNSISTNGEWIGAYGTGTVTQSGGTNAITNTLGLGYVTGASGTYNLSGTGALSANSEFVGYYGTGLFNQTGGTNTVANTLTIAANAGSSGTYNLSDGTLTVHNDAGTGEIINNDTFNYSGGTLNADIITNNANFNLSGTGTRTVNGSFTNNGTVKVTDTTVVYTNPFINNGAYISDPSDNYFTNLTVSDTGYIQGGAGDSFFISGDFSNSSTQSALWDTVDAYLGFTGTDALHDFWLTGIDMGADLLGYTDNFAWGTLALAAGNSLSLFDGNADADGALYLGLIAGLDILSGTIDNITGNGLNIYYDALLGGNDYLLGLDYALTGGGQLLAMNTGGGGGGTADVPEPATWMLMLVGMAGLFAFRRRQVIRG